LEKIKVLLVEDDPVWIQGLSDLLHKEEDLLVAGVVSTRQEALAFLTASSIDVIVLDIMLTKNRMDGIDAALEISAIGDYKIIMFTSLTASEVIIDSFTAGAVNYVNKLNYKDLPHVIRSVHQDQSAIHASAASVVRGEIQRLKREEIHKLISPTEKEILKLIDEGYTQSQIAKMTFSAERTIKNHINRILKKLQVESSKQAVEKVKKHLLF